MSRIVRTVARRAGIAAGVHPHLLRHAFGDHVAKHAGLHVAQTLLGHQSVATTATTYVDRPGLDELAGSVGGFRYSAVTAGPPARHSRPAAGEAFAVDAPYWLRALEDAQRARVARGQPASSWLDAVRSAGDTAR
jgi:hypothetical protein